MLSNSIKKQCKTKLVNELYPIEPLSNHIYQNDIKIWFSWAIFRECENLWNEAQDQKLINIMQ